jgi:transposase
VVDRLGPKDRLDGLEIIGIDEFSFRKRHKYLTVVCDHQRHRIVWAAEGMTTATAMKFFAELGVERCQAIRAVTMDMGTAYITAVRTAVPNAQLVFDRFHVQQLVSRALDKTRRQEWQRMRPKVSREAASDLKGYRWAVLKRPWNLSARDKAKLKTLEANNRRLYRAYLLKEQFVQIMDEHDPDLMKSQLRSWLTAASRSRLPEFVRTAKTLRKYVDDIVAYARLRRINNGLVEGLNNKARMVMRRAYGFHSAKSTIAMIMLCCGGVQLRPVVKCAQN